MRDSVFWRIVGAAAIATGLYIGHGLHLRSGMPLPDPFLATSAYAGNVAAIPEDTDYFVSASENGRTVFVWEFNGPRPPRFHARGDAKQ